MENKLSLITAQILHHTSWNDEEDKQSLLELIKPAIGIRTHKSSDEQLPVGKSKIGGQPDLPASFAWPFYRNEPLTFCAQYSCSELTLFDKEHALPSSGMLYIFIHIDKPYGALLCNRQSYKVIYTASTDLTRSTFPDDYFQEGIFETAAIDFFEFFTIPDDENYKLATLEKLTDDFHTAYDESYDIIKSVTAYDSYLLHQLLGEDRSIQSSVVHYFAERVLEIKSQEEFDANRLLLKEMQKEFVLLLQLDCNDRNTNLSKFGGSSVIYFGMKPQELKEMKFEQAVMAFQST